ncbi:hypothetical protein CHCC14821_0883 [Bacillus paralicheniformis]|nr:hypothetical protein CHCC14821_0883 [Bacillus paralicheniformis]
MMLERLLLIFSSLFTIKTPLRISANHTSTASFFQYYFYRQ